MDPNLVLGDEPLRRGAGKPHIVEELFRTGGEAVHVSLKHPNALTPGEYKRLLRQTPGAENWVWRVMVRNPEVYARGAVRHTDHETIRLPFWHRVVMNTEPGAVPWTESRFWIDEFGYPLR